MAEPFVIENEAQYKVTRYWIGRFEAAIRALAKNPPSAMRDIEVAACEGQLADLRKEAAAWEAAHSEEVSP